MSGTKHSKKLRPYFSKFVGPADLAFVFGDQTGSISAALEGMYVKTISIQPFSSYFKVLQKHFPPESGVILVHEDVGAFHAEFYHNGIYDKHILPYSSNLTADDTQEYVIITTLDELIERYGLPAFCHISGDGFEPELIKGLNSPVQTIAFTFYAYSSEKTTEILRRLLHIGDYQFNWKKSTEHPFQSKTWMNARELHQSISSHGKSVFSGEIYARVRQEYDKI
jgi:hypothetical protein